MRINYTVSIKYQAADGMLIPPFFMVVGVVNSVPGSERGPLPAECRRSVGAGTKRCLLNPCPRIPRAYFVDSKITRYLPRFYCITGFIMLG